MHLYQCRTITSSEGFFNFQAVDNWWTKSNSSNIQTIQKADVKLTAFDFHTLKTIRDKLESLFWHTVNIEKLMTIQCRSFSATDSTKIRHTLYI